MSGGTESLVAGNHTVSVKILTQTASPSPYLLADISVTVVNPAYTSEVLGWGGIVRTATLQNGDSISFPFRF